MMLERIDDLEKADPGPSWDGVFRATSKWPLTVKHLGHS
jgi:hypothetical protein